jgi:uncharacterized protein YdaU (DUF1376 family)
MSFQYMPLYTGDYLRDTRFLTPLKHGIYLLSLIHCWDSKGPMPLDEQECAGICNCRSADEIEALRYILGRFFVAMPDGHYNMRIQKEIERSEAISGVRSIAGKLGYEAKAKQLLSKSKASATTISPSPSPSPSPENTKVSKTVATGVNPIATKKHVSSETWASYAKAYEQRYGVEPVRNASVNAMLASLVNKLGESEAPAVAAFYVSHQKASYVAAGHSVKLLMLDAESLRTQWATGRKVMSRDACEADRVSSVVDMAGMVGAKLDAERLQITSSTKAIP